MSKTKRDKYVGAFLSKKKMVGALSYSMNGSANQTQAADFFSILWKIDEWEHLTDDCGKFRLLLYMEINK